MHPSGKLHCTGKQQTLTDGVSEELEYNLEYVSSHWQSGLCHNDSAGLGSMI